jgi:GrpB-like predicted nucleotidyltransferase (UPF0157 family)
VHPEAARRYEALKLSLTERLVGSDAESREAYARAKSQFIEEILALART